MKRAIRSQISGGARCDAGSSTKWICANTFPSAPCPSSRALRGGSDWIRQKLRIARARRLLCQIKSTASPSASLQLHTRTTADSPYRFAEDIPAARDLTGRASRRPGSPAAPSQAAARPPSCAHCPVRAARGRYPAFRALACAGIRPGSFRLRRHSCGYAFGVSICTLTDPSKTPPLIFHHPSVFDGTIGGRGQ